MTTESQAETTETEAAAAETAATETVEATETTAEETAAETTALGGKAEEAAEETKVEGAPEKYELKLPEDAPEGMKFDDETFAAIEPTLKALNLTNEGAQQLVDTYAKEVMPVLQKRADDTITQRAADQRKEWNDAFMADPEIGGAKKDETVSLAAKAFDFYGLKKGEGLRQLLDESGLGNHPDMIRFVARIGRDIGEGSFERGAITAEPLTVEEKFYGKGYGKPQAEQRS